MIELKNGQTKPSAYISANGVLFICDQPDSPLELRPLYLPPTEKDLNTRCPHSKGTEAHSIWMDGARSVFLGVA